MLAELAAAVLATATPPIVVTRDSLDLPAGCSPRETAARVSTLLDAWERGDARALDRLIAPAGSQPPGFRWFTTADLRIFERERVGPLLAAHPRRWRLVRLDVGRSWVVGGAGFGLSIWTGTGVVHGKGELHCASGRFYVWSTSAAEHGAAPEGPIVAESRAGRRPNAQEISPDFRVGETTVTLPPACRPRPVEARVRRLFRAFNIGAGQAFASGFVTDRPNFQPYTAVFRQYVTRKQIAAFVVRRFDAGDGWTAIELLPPQGTVGLPAWAVYGLRLEVGGVGPAGSKLVVDCRSGLLQKWVGPGVKPPG